MSELDLARAKAVEILYRREAGLAESAQVEVPPADIDRLAKVVDANRERLEAKVLHVLVKATSENRRVPRRHQRFAVVLVTVIVVIVLATYLLLGE